MAQSAMVLPLQSLAFGLLMPGVPERIAVTDAARRAAVALAGSTDVDVTFVLPSSLVAPDGSRIALRFDVADGGLLQSLGGAVTPLNPMQVSRVPLARNRIVLLLLGGTAMPTNVQRPGQYTARVLVLVSQPGT